MIEDEVLQLKEMSVNELKEMWTHYFKSEPVWKTKRYYIPRLAYRMQELAYGGISENIRKLLLSKTVRKNLEEERLNNNLPPVGTRLVKTYKGKEYSVIISTIGFQFEGKYYKSLSAIAKQIYGKHVSGNYFFGIRGNK